MWAEIQFEFVSRSPSVGELAREIAGLLRLECSIDEAIAATDEYAALVSQRKHVVYAENNSHGVQLVIVDDTQIVRIYVEQPKSRQSLQKLKEAILRAATHYETLFGRKRRVSKSISVSINHADSQLLMEGKLVSVGTKITRTLRQYWTAEAAAASLLLLLSYLGGAREGLRTGLVLLVVVALIWLLTDSSVFSAEIEYIEK